MTRGGGRWSGEVGGDGNDAMKPEMMEEVAKEAREMLRRTRDWMKKESMKE